MTRIQVSTADHPDEARIVAAAKELGVAGLRGCRRWTVYHLDGCLSPADVDRLCCEVLVDPVTDTAVVGPPPAAPQVVEVAPVAGVTDPVARELERAAATLGLRPLRAATARRYELRGDLDDDDIDVLIHRLLANPTIEHSSRGELAPAFSPVAPTGLAAAPVPLAGLDDDGLADLSRRRLLSLDTAEMRVIQSHFSCRGRDPTDAELETLAQTWSEHCAHKTFKARITLTHTRADGRIEVSDHDGLLAALRRATDELDAGWLRSVFVDNAGIIAFDDRLDLAVKVETHNHPSALEPFGGANTGVGGVVRDILGVSARPIACTDVLCFGPADLDDRDLPAGVLHPRRIRDGVVAGIGDYGNKLGLPTVNGAVIYDRGYVGNPLVFCGAVGLLPSGSHPTEPRPGDRIVVIGGRTGRDGIHGATFSSAGLDAAVAARAGSAVQIGDPITEKGCIEVVERARDLGLYNAITDCGAGGLSSAVGEMGAALGAAVDLAAAPLKYPGLQPWEIWVSEAQERMVLAVPAHHLAPLRRLCDEWDVEMSDIGSFGSDRRLVVRHGDLDVIDLPMSLVHDGMPPRTMAAAHCDPPASPGRPGGLDGVDPAGLLLDVLSHPNVCTREPIVRTYDHEVRGGTVVRPLVGPGADGPGDAAVLKPLGTWTHDMAVALSVGIAPRLTALDPWAMALTAIDEAFRNLVAVGADPDRVALLDNFCWGDPTIADRLGSLVRAVQGCVEGSRRYRAPFVSGKDSLYNEFEGDAVVGTLLISAVGLVADLHRATTSALTGAGHDLWLVGRGSRHLGGSLAAEVLGIADTRVPAPLTDPLGRYRAVHRLIAEGRVTAAHDVSDGGVAVALAEMAIGGRLGLQATIPWDFHPSADATDMDEGDRAEPHRAEAHRAEPHRAEAHRAEHDRAEPHRAEHDRAEPHRAEDGRADEAGGLIAALVNEAPGQLVLESPAAERAAVAAALGGIGRRIGTVTGTGRIEIRVEGPNGMGTQLNLTVEAARRAFGCGSAEP